MHFKFFFTYFTATNPSLFRKKRFEINFFPAKGFKICHIYRKRKLCRHRLGHSLGVKVKSHKMKTKKKHVGFLMSKVWQILKRFAGTFCQAQTFKLWGVLCYRMKVFLLKIFTKGFWKVCFKGSSVASYMPQTQIALIRILPN